MGRLAAKFSSRYRAEATETTANVLSARTETPKTEPALVEQETEPPRDEVTIAFDRITNGPELRVGGKVDARGFDTAQAFLAHLPLLLHDDSTQQRWKSLFAAATRPGSHPGYELHIIVPTGCLDEAKQQATDGGVIATFHTSKLAD